VIVILIAHNLQLANAKTLKSKTRNTGGLHRRHQTHASWTGR